MPDRELTGFRADAFRALHRTPSIMRFFPPSEYARVDAMKSIDLDGISCEYDDGTKEPLFLVETVCHKENSQFKPYSVVAALAARCWPLLEAYLVRYVLAKHTNPADPRWYDIERLMPMRVFPSQVNYDWMTPKQYFVWLLARRDEAVDRLKPRNQRVTPSRLTPDYFLFD
jgi:hypothetical protein